MNVTPELLADTLTDFRVVVTHAGQSFTGSVKYPRELADLMFAQLSANAAHDGDVVDAHICCEHAEFADPEVSAMAGILRLMETHPFDPHAVIRALYPLNGKALPRVLHWFLARFPDPGDLPF